MAFQFPLKTKSEKIENLTDSVAGKVVGRDVLGMNVAVAKKGKIFFLKNYGLADIEMGTQVKASTIFGIASITKQFTAATIMKLVEQGKISLKDPITKFLPTYPVQGNNVRIHHLLSHTSGMKDFGFNHPELPTWYTSVLNYDKMISLWANQPFDNSPGEHFDYSNWGYYLLGQIIERVTGIPWGKYAEPKLLKPLGLNNVVFANHLRIVPGRAKGYMHIKDTLVNVPYRNMEIFSAGGGLSSTIEDIVQWTYLLHSGKVVSKESLEKMITPTVLENNQKVGYGYGLYVNDLRGHKKIYHGGTFGFGAYVAHYPEEEITIAILSNSTKGREVAENLEEILATELLKIKIKNLTLTDAEITTYTGVYSYKSTPTKVRELQVFGDKGKLMAKIGDGRAFQLRFQGNHKFIPDVRGITNINFEVKANKAVGLTIHEGAWEVTEGIKLNARNE